MDLSCCSPNTKDLEGGWGYIKVSGTIDDFEIKSKNLMPQKGKDMLMSVNAAQAVRKSSTRVRHFIPNIMNDNLSY